MNVLICSHKVNVRTDPDDRADVVNILHFGIFLVIFENSNILSKKLAQEDSQKMSDLNVRMSGESNGCVVVSCTKEVLDQHAVKALFLPLSGRGGGQAVQLLQMLQPSLAALRCVHLLSNALVSLQVILAFCWLNLTCSTWLFQPKISFVVTSPRTIALLRTHRWRKQGDM